MASQVYHSLDRALGPKLVDFTSHIQQNLIVSVPLTLALLSIVGWKLWNRNVAPLPPGPPRLPILGNLFDMPKEYDWLHYISLRSKFGPINSLTTLGQTIIILNSSSTITDLMEKCSSIYSDKPQMPFAGELVGWNATLGGTDAGELLKAQRRTMHRVMGTTAAVVGKFAVLIEGEARRFVRRVIEQPEKLERFVRMETGAIILKLTYGYSTETERSDPLVNLAEKTMENFSLAMQPSAWAVNSLPFLRHVPAWFPGAGWKRTAVLWRKTLTDLVDIPFEWVKTQVATGKIYDPSMVSEALEQNPSPEEEYSTRMAAMAMFTGGSDTTVSAIMTFFLAMLIHPEIQRKAQAEINRVIGTDRLPRLEDRASLTFVDAMVKEILRWGVVVPMGLPHAVKEEDTYSGYRIPKRSIVVANIWGVLHDPEIYHDPETFNPNRHLPGGGKDGKDAEKDPRGWCFGFGRRVCPGKELADAQIFITIATVLATLDISRVRDENGREVIPHKHMESGVISHPKPFNVALSLHTDKGLDLLSAANENYEDGQMKENDERKEIHEVLRANGHDIFRERR